MPPISSIETVRQIWPDIGDQNFVYDDHYRRYVDYINQAFTRNSRPVNSHATPTVEHALKLITHVRELHTVTRKDAMLNHLRQAHTTDWTHATDDKLYKSIDLAFSIWLCLNIGTTGTSHRWDRLMTVSSVISAKIPGLPDTISRGQWPSHVLPPSLTVEYLCTYHGFKVNFTDELSQHLNIVWDNLFKAKPTISIYQHKIFLWNELRFPRRSPLPQELVGETLDTLNLLLPYNHQPTYRLLKSHGMQDFHGLGWCGRGDRNRNLDHYKYWGDRLRELEDILKESPILGRQQLTPGYHGRNLREFLTFWTTIFVVILTIVSIVFGALSLIYAVKAYNMAVLQYDLSLAQACAAPNAASDLPRFC